MKLQEICHFIVDCPHSTAPDEGVGIPLIRTPNIGFGRFNMEGVHRVSEKVYQARCARAIPQNNDIIFAREALAGNAAIIKNNEKMCLGQRTVLIRPNPEKVCPDYLVYYLLAPVQQYKLLGTANGATVAHVNLPTIREMNVDNLPPIEVQRKIADVLSAYDDLIENNRRQIKLLEEAARRLYKEWFIDLRFPGHESTPIINGIPNGWERKRLSDFANITMGQSPKSEFYNKDRVGLPFHQGVGSFGERFVVDETYSNSFTRLADPGDILFSVRAPVGRLNITLNKIVIGRGLAAIKHKDNQQSFLYYMLKEHFFKDDIVGNGSIFASITKDELLELKLLFPTQELCKSFNKHVEIIDSKIIILSVQLQNVIESRDRLLPKLMTGELEVE